MKENLSTELYERFRQSQGVSTDTRSIREGQIFFALKGPNFDANTFARQAIEKGAILAVVDRSEPDFVDNKNFLVVEDSLEALQWLAGRYRQTFNIPVIALTGSNGKTTTKELTHGVLSKKYRTLSTSGNLNNHIGVPLTVLSIQQDTEIALIELGANHIGEIALLCEICQPTHGLITNIGKDHLEGFGSFEGSLRANSELYQYLIENSGVAFINSGDPILKNMAKRFDSPVFYSSKGDYYHAQLVEETPYLRYQSESGTKTRTQIIGDFNFTNLTAALCIGKFFDVPEIYANEAIAEYVPRNNRSQWIKTESNFVFLDAYNANPSSMQVALNSFQKMQGAKKCAILGDMFGAVEDDGSGSKLHLKIVGTTENYEILYDAAGVKKKILADFKKEVNELKDAFRKKEKIVQEAKLNEEEFFEWEEDTIRYDRPRILPHLNNY